MGAQRLSASRQGGPGPCASQGRGQTRAQRLSASRQGGPPGRWRTSSAGRRAQRLSASRQGGPHPRQLVLLCHKRLSSLGPPLLQRLCQHDVSPRENELYDTVGLEGCVVPTCSTPLGITARGTPGCRPARSLPSVLNASRHHGKGDATMPWVLPSGRSAQRLSASRQGGLRRHGGTRTRASCAQRLSASRQGGPARPPDDADA